MSKKSKRNRSVIVPLPKPAGGKAINDVLKTRKNGKHQEFDSSDRKHERSEILRELDL
jgi:hypothetical protein